jgi:hypothetical protein
MATTSYPVLLKLFISWPYRRNRKKNTFYMSGFNRRTRGWHAATRQTRMKREAYISVEALRMFRRLQIRARADTQGLRKLGMRKFKHIIPYSLYESHVLNIIDFVFPIDPRIFE